MNAGPSDGTTRSKPGSTVRNKRDPLHVVYRRALQGRDHPQPRREPAPPRHDHPETEIANPKRVSELLEALLPAERAAWSTAFYAGLRVGELRALRWRHVDFDASRIHVEAGWDDQDGEQNTETIAGERTIPLAGRLRADLARHKLATGRDLDALCFGRTPSSAFVRSTLRSRALAAWAKARLEPLTPHLRQLPRRRGVTPEEAQTAMGHADIRTTMNHLRQGGTRLGGGSRVQARRLPRRRVRDSCETVDTPSPAVDSGSLAI